VCHADYRDIAVDRLRDVPSNAVEVARAAGTHTSQLFRWRQQLCGPAASSDIFAPVAIVPDGAAPAAATFDDRDRACGRTRVRITGAADPPIVSALIAELAKIARPR
jgi:transposase